MQIYLANPRGFCAGVDIKELAADSNKILSVNKGNYDTFAAIHRNPKPVIVALHGFVLGGGIGIAGAADIIVAAECARFGVPEVDRGALGGGGRRGARCGARRAARPPFTCAWFQEAHHSICHLIRYQVTVSISFHLNHC